MNYIRQIIIGFVLIAVMVLAVGLQIKINEAAIENQDTKNKLEELQFEHESLKNQLEAPVDEEYISKVASEQLDYVDPDVMYFVNAQPN